ncbi:VOC family protein, partial [Enterobacter roggenkampii]
MISFGYTILYVSDVQKSLQFYQDIFDLPLKFCTPELDYAELITG